MLKIGNDWDKLLKDESGKEYFKRLREHLKNEYQNYTIFPHNSEIFTAFKLTPYSSVKVVILGQDPYHGKGQAHGLAFSVKKGIDIPPSLKNIYKEIISEGEGTHFEHGCLESWAKQGVFLLNATLTVREGEANSHKDIGWHIFTDEVIKKINEKDEPVIFLLWGNNARDKKKFITNPIHKIFESVHPSPLSVNRGFWGSNHFKLVNEELRKRGKKIIDWSV